MVPPTHGDTGDMRFCNNGYFEILILSRLRMLQVADLNKSESKSRWNTKSQFPDQKLQN